MSDVMDKCLKCYVLLTLVLRWLKVGWANVQERHCQGYPLREKSDVRRNKASGGTGYNTRMNERTGKAKCVQPSTS